MSRYADLDAIITDFRTKSVPVRDDDVARLSPLGHAHLNCLALRLHHPRRQRTASAA